MHTIKFSWYYLFNSLEKKKKKNNQEKDKYWPQKMLAVINLFYPVILGGFRNSDFSVSQNTM